MQAPTGNLQTQVMSSLIGVFVDYLGNPFAGLASPAYRPDPLEGMLT